MRKTLWTLFLLWFPSFFRGLRGHHEEHMEITRLKMSLMYVKSIKTFRLLFMSILGMGVCLILLLVGLILFHISLFLYAPWSMESKLLVGLFCSVVYLMTAFITFFKIFSSDRWLKIFHADTIMDHLNKEAIPEQSVNTPE